MVIFLHIWPDLHQTELATILKTNGWQQTLISTMLSSRKIKACIIFLSLSFNASHEKRLLIISLVFELLQSLILNILDQGLFDSF